MTPRLPARWTPPAAAGQSGLFTARQAVAAGATPGQVRRRRASGGWVTVVGDALAPAGLVVTPWIVVQGVALSWPGAVVGLSTAAAFHGFPVSDDAVHLLVPRRVRRRPGVVTHELRLDPQDVVQVGRGLVTSRQRTLFDCIGRLDTDSAERLVAWAATREAVSAPALERALETRPGWWGNRARRQAVQDLMDGTLSAAERRLHRILTDAGITGWAFNQRVSDADGFIGRADVLFAELRLVIEADGWASHGRAQFQQDRTRQNRLVAAGCTVLRFTWADLTDRPASVADQIRTTISGLSRAGKSGLERT